MSAPDFQFRDLKPLFPLLIISLIFKLVLAALLPLTADESYYWVWSHHMQLSYFDHPPAIAWLFWLTHPIENFGGAARWAGVLLSHATLVIWLLILKPYLRIDQLRIWLWLALLSPLIGAGSLIMTPDIPMMFCWALSLHLFLRWVEAPTYRRSFELGLSAGLGFCAKYVFVLEPMFLTFAAFMIPSWRSAMKKGWWLIAIGVIIGSTPVWLWNYLNHFASFRFQADHGLGRAIWKPSWTYEYLLAQFGLIFPPILYWAIKGTKKAPAWMWILAWGPVAFFAATSFRGYAEANWPIIAYTQIFALAVLAMPRPTLGYRITIGTWTTALVALLVLIVTQWSPQGSMLKTKREFSQFDSLRAPAAELNPIYARSYQMASQLTFAIKKPIYKLRSMNRRDFYDFMPESMPTTDQFYLMAEKTDGLPPEYTEMGYKIVSRDPVDKADPENEFEILLVKKQ